MPQARIFNVQRYYVEPFNVPPPSLRPPAFIHLSVNRFRWIQSIRTSGRAIRRRQAAAKHHQKRKFIHRSHPSMRWSVHIASLSNYKICKHSTLYHFLSHPQPNGSPSSSCVCHGRSLFQTNMFVSHSISAITSFRIRFFLPRFVFFLLLLPAQPMYSHEHEHRK